MNKVYSGLKFNNVLLIVHGFNKKYEFAETSEQPVNLAFIDSFPLKISPNWRIANGGNKRLQK